MQSHLEIQKFARCCYYREWKRKTATEKTWTNFKKCFSAEIREYQHNQVITARSTYNVANSANQKMHQSQLDFRQLSSEMMDNLREEFYDALTPDNSTPITSNQQCHLTQKQAYHNQFNQQQAHLNQSTDISNLMSIIQDLKKEVKSLKENKENLNPTKSTSPRRLLSVSGLMDANPRIKETIAGIHCQTTVREQP